MKEVAGERIDAAAAEFSVAAKPNKSKKKTKWRDELLPFLFIGPHLIFFIVFVLVPFVFGIVISFTKWDMVGTPEFLGLGNYGQLFTDTVFSYEFCHLHLPLRHHRLCRRMSSICRHNII